MSYFSNVINTKIVWQKVLDGKGFYTHEEVTVGNGTVRDYLITTGANEVMMFCSLQNDDAATVSFYSGPTVSANGTALTLYNMRRSSAETPLISVYHTPTITADGTLLEEGRIFSATNIPIYLSPSRDLGIGWILDASTNYLIRFTNDSGASEDLLTSFAFFQVP